MIKHSKKFYLDGTQILPTALLDVYKVNENIKAEIKNFECKKEFISLSNFFIIKQLMKMNDEL